MLDPSKRPLPNIPLNDWYQITNRLQPHFLIMMTQVDAFLLANDMMLGKTDAHPPEAAGQWLANQFNVKLQLMIYQHFERAFRGEDAPKVLFRYEPIEVDFDPSTLGTLRKDFIIKPMLAHLSSLTLMAYYQEFIEEVSEYKRQYPDADTSVWQFARVVRNAVAHGKITINDPNFQPVSWHTLTYGREDNGRSIIGLDLNFSDLVTLMIEMDLRLTAFGINGERVNNLFLSEEDR